MKPEDFKYRTRFYMPIETVYASQHGQYISTASLQDLKSLAGSEQDIKTNWDLLYNAFNAAVINRINKNEDGIESSTAVKIYKNFIHKPQNIEHNRNLIVGHIINAGFSKFLTNEPLSESEASEMTDPFYLNLAAVVYKVADPELVNILVESADETSPNFQKVCASWELGFNDYKVLLGHRDIKEGELITDPKQVQAFSQYLKSYGGQGKLDDGTACYRVLSGDVLPLGCGYTTSPAAEVEGIVLNTPAKPDDPDENGEFAQPIGPFGSDEDKGKEGKDGKKKNKKGKDADDDDDNSDDDFDEDQARRNEIFEVNSVPENSEEVAANINLLQNQENNKENQNNSSQTNTQPVKIISIMTLKDINEASIAGLSEEAKAAINSFFVREIDKISSEYAEKMDKVQTEVQTKTAEAENARQSLESLRTEFEQIKNQLEQANHDKDAAQAQADFDARMSDLNEKYNLTDKDREAITKRIRGMNAESYSGWYNDEFAILAEQKKKAANQPAAQASASTIEEALDDAPRNASHSSIPNNVAEVNKNPRAEWAEAFKLEDILIPINSKRK